MNPSFIIRFGITFLLLSIAVWLFMPSEEDFAWQLTVDQPLVYRSDIKITGAELTISGSQTNVGEGNTIVYTLMKKDRSRHFRPFQNLFIAGDRSHFRHTFTDVPNGSEYRISVYNYGRCLCTGQFNIE